MSTARRLPLKASLSMMAIVISALGACVLGPTVDLGLERVIKAHYASHATEEDGICRTPRIDTVRSYQTNGMSGRGDEVMTVRYSYYDRNADMDANWSGFFNAAQPCGGLAERNFSVTRTELGYRVTDMAGERRGDGRTN